MIDSCTVNVTGRCSVSVMFYLDEEHQEDDSEVCGRMTWSCIPEFQITSCQNLDYKEKLRSSRFVCRILMPRLTCVVVRALVSIFVLLLQVD